MKLLFEMPLDMELLGRCFQATCRDFAVALPPSVAAASGFSQEFAERNARLWRDRRWPEWTGAPFKAGRDPEFTDVVAAIASHAERAGLIPETPGLRL